MHTDNILSGKSVIKRSCEYCSLKINPEDEESYKGRVYHAKCAHRKRILTENQEVFRQMDSIRSAFEYLFGVSESWIVNHKTRVAIIYRSLGFVIRLLDKHKSQSSYLSRK